MTRILAHEHQISWHHCHHWSRIRVLLLQNSYHDTIIVNRCNRYVNLRYKYECTTSSAFSWTLILMFVKQNSLISCSVDVKCQYYIHVHVSIHCSRWQSKKVKQKGKTEKSRPSWRLLLAQEAQNGQSDFSIQALLADGGARAREGGDDGGRAVRGRGRAFL